MGSRSSVSRIWIKWSDKGLEQIWSQKGPWQGSKAQITGQKIIRCCWWKIRSLRYSRSNSSFLGNKWWYGSKKTWDELEKCSTCSIKIRNLNRVRRWNWQRRVVRTWPYIKLRNGILCLFLRSSLSSKNSSVKANTASTRILYSCSLSNREANCKESTGKSWY